MDTLSRGTTPSKLLLPISEEGAILRVNTKKKKKKKKKKKNAPFSVCAGGGGWG